MTIQSSGCKNADIFRVMKKLFIPRDLPFCTIMITTRNIYLNLLTSDLYVLSSKSFHIINFSTEII